MGNSLETVITEADFLHCIQTETISLDHEIWEKISKFDIEIFEDLIKNESYVRQIKQISENNFLILIQATLSSYHNLIRYFIINHLKLTKTVISYLNVINFLIIITNFNKKHSEWNKPFNGFGISGKAPFRLLFDTSLIVYQNTRRRKELVVQTLLYFAYFMVGFEKTETNMNLFNKIFRRFEPIQTNIDILLSDTLNNDSNIVFVFFSAVYCKFWSEKLREFNDFSFFFKKKTTYMSSIFFCYLIYSLERNEKTTHAISSYIDELLKDFEYFSTIKEHYNNICIYIGNFLIEFLDDLDKSKLPTVFKIVTQLIITNTGDIVLFSQLLLRTLFSYPIKYLNDTCINRIILINRVFMREKSRITNGSEQNNEKFILCYTEFTRYLNILHRESNLFRLLYSHEHFLIQKHQCYIYFDSNHDDIEQKTNIIPYDHYADFENLINNIVHSLYTQQLAYANEIKKI